MPLIANTTARLLQVNLDPSKEDGVLPQYRVPKRFNFPPGTSEVSKDELARLDDHWYFQRLVDAGDLSFSRSDLREGEEINKEAEEELGRVSGDVNSGNTAPAEGPVTQASGTSSSDAETVAEAAIAAAAQSAAPAAKKAGSGVRKAPAAKKAVK